MEVEKSANEQEPIQKLDNEGNLVGSIEMPSTLKETVSDEQLQKTALNSAQQLFELVSKNWFTAFDVRNKLHIDLNEVIEKLNALKLFGVIYEKIVAGEKRYKVTLTDKQRKELIDDDIDFYTKKVEILKNQSKKLEEKINLSNKSNI